MWFVLFTAAYIWILLLYSQDMFNDNKIIGTWILVVWLVCYMIILRIYLYLLWIL